MYVCLQLGQSENIAERCKASCAAQDIPFYRFSPPLDKKVEPTETDSRKLIDIMITSRINMHTREDYKLDKLLPLLLMSNSCSDSPRLSRWAMWSVYSFTSLIYINTVGCIYTIDCMLILACITHIDYHLLIYFVIFVLIHVNWSTFL